MASRPASVAKSAFRIVANAAVVLCLLAFCCAGHLKYQASGQRNWLACLIVNGLLVCRYVARRDSASIATVPLAWPPAFAGTVAPVLMRPADPGTLAMTLAGNALQVAGGGMYRLVRHPLHGAGLLMQLGVVLGNPSSRNLVLWLPAILRQRPRARTEERFLSADPDYGAYLERVRHRFVPGVTWSRRPTRRRRCGADQPRPAGSGPRPTARLRSKRSASSTPW